MKHSGLLIFATAVRIIFVTLMFELIWYEELEYQKSTNYRLERS